MANTKRKRAWCLGIARIHRIWQTMLYRCYNPSHKYYGLYGGRGIDVCSEWQDREAFTAWAVTAGYEDGLTLDRIDNSKGYCPENCRWATRRQQANNRKSCEYVKYHGQTLTISEIAEIAGIPYSTALMRHRRGWTPDRIVDQKLGSYRFKNPVQVAENRRRVATDKWRSGDYTNRSLPQRRKNHVCNSGRCKEAAHEEGGGA